jgi:alpha-L-arabinofuranosidase
MLAIVVVGAVLAQNGTGSQLSRSIDGQHFLGFNVVNLQSGNFTTDRAYLEGTAALHAGILRYPGGNIADYWDWQLGWCVPNTTSCSTERNPCKNKKRVRRYLLEEFKRAVDTTQSLPTYTLNMLTGSLDHQLAMLKHAQSINILPAGSYVELGGEFYWGKVK